MEQNSLLKKRLKEVYDWLTTQLKNPSAGNCQVCGECCDFKKYDHRLFVTPVELLYLPGKTVKPANGDKCPYQRGGKCGIYKYRFSGCRIFCCNGDAAFQSELSEQTIKKLISLCEEFKIDYRYMDLATALNEAAD